MVDLGTIEKLRRLVDSAGSRTWIVYEDNKVGGGIYAKVVPFAEIDTIVSNNPPAQYGNLLLAGPIQALTDNTVYARSASGNPQYTVKDISLNLYQNFVGVAVVTGKLPNDDAVRVHLGQLSIGAGGNLTYTACTTSPLDIPNVTSARYDVIPGVNKELNIIHTRNNKVHCNGH
jgi:hypothetical protein